VTADYPEMLVREDGMKWVSALCAVLALFTTASLAFADGTCETQKKQLMLKLMKETKIEIVALSGQDITPDKFVPDTDPDTLQIVFLNKKSDGPSRVSDDGEVIFLQSDVTEQEQDALMDTGFERKAAKRLNCH
jgi:hypothetical protein